MGGEFSAARQLLYEVVFTKHGYALMAWEPARSTWYSAEHMATPEVLAHALCPEQITLTFYLRSFLFGQIPLIVGYLISIFISLCYILPFLFCFEYVYVVLLSS